MRTILPHKEHFPTKRCASNRTIGSDHPFTSHHSEYPAYTKRMRILTATENPTTMNTEIPIANILSAFVIFLLREILSAIHVPALLEVALPANFHFLMSVLTTTHDRIVLSVNCVLPKDRRSSSQCFGAFSYSDELRLLASTACLLSFLAFSICSVFVWRGK